jgi:BASS family bile acid:Na+ symporter
VAAGIVLMAISPGAPVALRRALDVGGRARFAPALHLAIVLLAVVTVPLSILVLDAVFEASFRVSPLDVGRQVLTAQLVPLGVGASIRMLRPMAAARLEPALTRLSNLLLLGLLGVCVYTLWPMLVDIGWMPTLAGIILTACALLVGALFAGRDADARPPGAVAAAMRNPGLALLIATVNRAPSAVTAAVFGYALGAAAIVTIYVLWYGGRTPPRTSLEPDAPASPSAVAGTGDGAALRSSCQTVRESLNRMQNKSTGKGAVRVRSGGALLATGVLAAAAAERMLEGEGMTVCTAAAQSRRHYGRSRL